MVGSTVLKDSQAGMVPLSSIRLLKLKFNKHEDERAGLAYSPANDWAYLVTKEREDPLLEYLDKLIENKEEIGVRSSWSMGMELSEYRELEYSAQQNMLLYFIRKSPGEMKIRNQLWIENWWFDTPFQKEGEGVISIEKEIPPESKEFDFGEFSTQLPKPSFPESLGRWVLILVIILLAVFLMLHLESTF